MIELQSVCIISSRLVQIPINEDYVKDIFENFTEEITRYMYPQPTGDIKDIEKFVSESMKGIKNGTNLQMVILSKSTEKFLGCSGLHNLNQKNPELGIWLKKEAHGNQYGYEAIKSLVSWARENIEFEYLKYPVDRNNYASRRIPEKLHGRIAKEYKSENINGGELDTVEYWIY